MAAGRTNLWQCLVATLLLLVAAMASRGCGSSEKKQTIPTNVPVSENSSTNHSIGSTQSTPCSTSSVA